MDAETSDCTKEGHHQPQPSFLLPSPPPDEDRPGPRGLGVLLSLPGSLDQGNEPVLGAGRRGKPGGEEGQGDSLPRQPP